MNEPRMAARQRAALACIRRYATDAHVSDWFNRTYRTKLKAPIIELMGSIHEQEQRAHTQAAYDVDTFVQFIIMVLWPRLQQANRAAAIRSLGELGKCAGTTAAMGKKGAPRDIGGCDGIGIRWAFVRVSRIDSLFVQ